MSDGQPQAADRRALLEGALISLVFLGLIWGLALLGGGPQARVESPVRSSVLLGSLMLGLVALRVFGPDWRSRLSVRPPSLEDAFFGGLGVAAIYAGNAALVGIRIAASGGVAQLTSEAQEKAKWATTFADVPLWVVLPLSLFVAVWEEAVFRGYLLGRFKAGLGTHPRGPAIAVAVTALVFGLAHGYQGGWGMAQTALVGAALGALTLWRGSLWPAVVAHFSIDAIGLFALHFLKPMLEKLLHGATPPG